MESGFPSPVFLARQRGFVKKSAVETRSSATGTRLPLLPFPPRDRRTCADLRRRKAPTMASTIEDQPLWRPRRRL